MPPDGIAGRRPPLQESRVGTWGAAPGPSGAELGCYPGPGRDSRVWGLPTLPCKPTAHLIRSARLKSRQTNNDGQLVLHDI